MTDPSGCSEDCYFGIGGGGGVKAGDCGALVVAKGCADCSGGEAVDNHDGSVENVEIQ